MQNKVDVADDRQWRAWKPCVLPPLLVVLLNGERAVRHSPAGMRRRNARLPGALLRSEVARLRIDHTRGGSCSSALRSSTAGAHSASTCTF